MNMQTNRRALLGAMALAPVMAVPAAPLLASARTPFRVAEARYWAAYHHYNALPGDLETMDPAQFQREQDAFLATVNVVDRAPVQDWDEFAAQFDIACDQGNSLPNEDVIFKLLADAQRLAKGGLA